MKTEYTDVMNERSEVGIFQVGCKDLPMKCLIK